MINEVLLDQLKIYNNGVERIVTPEFLDNLGNGLLGSNASKNTVLHLVSKIGNVASVQYVLAKHPSQINCLNSDMETPAYIAAREGHVDILEFMINYLKKENQDIKSIFTRSIDGQSVFHIAVQKYHLEVVFLLIKNSLNMQTVSMNPKKAHFTCRHKTTICSCGTNIEHVQ
ncbi:hypothetical protein L1987_58221 [Smallanthus sonchifolius]|uniref:Uncharacterized protein n=1 Tax=Smallanthus sonchifolius TaxID=185202 RepID=A0ACB9DEL8_9ASTR|nr:hypothetical protein L1987_58221 [Smallanthus sonchifolius]